VEHARQEAQRLAAEVTRLSALVETLRKEAEDRLAAAVASEAARADAEARVSQAQKASTDSELKLAAALTGVGERLLALQSQCDDGERRWSAQRAALETQLSDSQRQCQQLTTEVHAALEKVATSEMARAAAEVRVSQAVHEFAEVRTARAV
jgi:predicted  nucleic acid-binding Zn-ribbon protein